MQRKIYKLISIFMLLSQVFTFSTAEAQNWSSFPNGGANDWVYSSCIYNGELIVGGKFTAIGGVNLNHIARWDGSNWQPLGLGVNGKVNALAVYNGALYVGGEFTLAGGIPLNFIAKWDGTNWLNDLGDMGSIVTSMVVYNNKLIVGGYFTDADGTPANYIASHDGNNWAALGAGLGGGQGQVMTLDIYNNQLIAGGFFTSAGGSPASHIAKWNGTSWSSLGSGISGIVYSLTKYNGSLIAGGLFLGAGGSSANHIASWNGSSWSALGSGMSGTFYQYVLALTTFNGNLIAGGYFTHSNGIMTNGIAQWNGSAWSPISGGLWYPANVYGAHTFCQYGQDLIVGGLFTNAGGINTSHIAKLNFITPGVSLNLKLYLEGYYTGAGLMTATLSNQGIGTNQTITDSIDVDLYDTALSYIETTKAVLNTNGTASCSFLYALPGNYYVVIRQRNCIETWSASPIFLTAIPSTYDFTNASTKAYGNNMKELAPATWGLYSGELNADGNIDLLDNIDLEYSILNFDNGYVPTDINGDGNVDLLDTPIMENNINDFVFSNHP